MRAGTRVRLGLGGNHGGMAVTDESTASPARGDLFDVFVGMLSEVDADREAPPSNAFHDRLCEAVCKLTAMQRAVLFLYDPADQRVELVGAHGLDRARLGDLDVTLDDAPMARRALAEDSVVVVDEGIEDEITAAYARLFGVATLTCTPLAAGGRWLGVLFADRGGGHFDLTDEERHAMWTLGKTAALASSAWLVTREQEHARRLSDRLDFAREIHDRVIQRLFGVSLVLGADGALSPSRAQALPRRAARRPDRAALGAAPAAGDGAPARGRLAARGPRARRQRRPARVRVRLAARRSRSRAPLERLAAPCWPRPCATPPSTPTRPRSPRRWPARTASSSSPSATTASRRAGRGPTRAWACAWSPSRRSPTAARWTRGRSPADGWAAAALRTPAGGDMSESLRMLVVDDHDVVHWGFRLLLSEQPWVERCFSARDGDAAVALARRHRPDVALVDLFIGDQSGTDICASVLAASPDTSVLLISGAGPVSAQTARRGRRGRLRVQGLDARRRRQGGAHGRAGHDGVHARQRAARRSGCRRASARCSTSSPRAPPTGEIGDRLFLSPHTVKEHTSALYRKLGVRNRAEAVQQAQRRGLLV